MELHGNLYLKLTLFVVILRGVDMQDSECLGGVMIHGECQLCSGEFCSSNPKFCSGCEGPCDQNPCIHGRCSEGPKGTYICSCMNGWTGLNCTMPDVLYCESNPCHHGTCTEGTDRYICLCPTEWTGANCETQDVLYCESNPCYHGNCTEGTDRYICLCPTEWTGANCETQGSSPPMISRHPYFTVLMGAILAILIVMPI